MPGRRLTDLEPAGFARRACAFVADLLVVGAAVVMLLQFVLAPLRAALGPGWGRVGWFYIGYALLTISVPIWLYFAGYESAEGNATPGKRWLGIAVTSAAGGPVSFGRALLRTILKLLPFEIAHAAVALPTNPFIDPVTGGLTVPALGSLGPSVLGGLLVALLLLGALLFSTILHADGRGMHDLAAGTWVVRPEREGARSALASALSGSTPGG